MNVKVYIQWGCKVLLGLLLALTMPATLQARKHGAGQESLAALFQHAAKAQRAGSLDEAAQAYQQILKLDPKLAEASMNLALVREEQGRQREAIGLLSNTIALKPGLRGAHLFLAIAEYRVNDLPAAEKSIAEEVRLQPRDARALMWMGIIGLASGDLDKAAGALDRAAVLDPRNVDILYHCGRAHLLLSQRSYQRMFSADPNSWRVHQVLAQSFVEADRDAEAVSEYQLALKLAPQEPGLNEELANLYWKDGKLDEAEAAYEQELHLDPSSANVLYKLGSLREQRAHAAEAIPLLQEAIKQNPKIEGAYYFLGKAQSETGENELAVASLKKAIDLDPEGETAQSSYYQLSLLYRRLHQPDQARLALVSFERLKEESQKRSAQKLDQKKKSFPSTISDQ